jgi:hypothetical protein
MNDIKNISHEFGSAGDRKAQERERLVRQLSEPDQRHVDEMRNQHNQDVLERRQLQGAFREVDVHQVRQELLLEHPRPSLRPENHRPFVRSAGDLDRMAARKVDDRNAQEIAAMSASRDQAVDRFLEQKGLTYERFKPEREQLQQQREQTRAVNDITREI